MSAATACAYLPVRYAVGDEQQVKVRCGRLIATQYGRLGVLVERHRGGLFELYSPTGRSCGGFGRPPGIG